MEQAEPRDESCGLRGWPGEIWPVYRVEGDMHRFQGAHKVFLPLQVDLHAGEAGTSGRIQCPVCRNGRLADRNGVLLCSSCALRMDLRFEGLSLEDVR